MSESKQDAQDSNARIDNRVPMLREVMTRWERAFGSFEWRGNTRIDEGPKAAAKDVKAKAGSGDEAVRPRECEERKETSEKT